MISACLVLNGSCRQYLIKAKTFASKVTNIIEYVKYKLNLQLTNIINRYLNWSPSGPMETNNKTNNLNKHDMVKNRNWQETNQFAQLGSKVTMSNNVW